MYTIIKTLDGRILCEGRLQDGTERWEVSSVEEGVRRMKQFAEVGNGVKIKKRDIQFVKERKKRVEQTYYVEWEV